MASPRIRVPTHAERGDYLPPYAKIDQSPADARRTAQQAAREAWSALRSGRHAVALKQQYTEAYGSPGTHGSPPSKVATGEKVVGAEEGLTGEPMRASGAADGGESSVVVHGDTSPHKGAPSTGKWSGFGSFRGSARYQPRLGSPRSPRGRGVTHMWEVVRFVSGVYGDVHKQVK